MVHHRIVLYDKTSGENVAHQLAKGKLLVTPGNICKVCRGVV